jgi:2-C-methyl-D-erythritol 4-phosphate cytidylyltransferase / 2-C-methyl-D-erythritol 2,4-cyclodiphosphate synthase
VTTTAALIVAAGRGSRARAAQGHPKQYETLGGLPILTHTLKPFVAHEAVQTVQVVIHADDRELYDRAVACLDIRLPVVGGATRQASVLAGLEALSELEPDRVLIHDAARPFVTRALITDVLAALDDHRGAIAAEPLADSLKQASPDGLITGTIDRTGLWRAQTPQGFHFDAILQAHRAARDAGHNDFSDDAAVAAWAGVAVHLVAGSSNNGKITTRDDVTRANQTMNAALFTRSGLGFDVHAFTAGDHVWLGGVKIPHSAKLDGHSDADVVLHALTDALLGTIGDGDIGQHFPPSDPQWKGAASILFLEDAVRRVHARGGRIINADITVLAEAPRIGPYRPQMQSVIAAALGVQPRDVGIKATTTETLGFVGRREGIAAMAVASVALPG